MESYNEQIQKKTQEGKQFDFQQKDYRIVPKRTLDEPAFQRRQQTLDPRKRRPLPTSTTGSSLWDLDVDSTFGRVQVINQGTIIKDFSSLTQQLSISNRDNIWSPSVGQKLFIKITGPALAPVATMEIGSNWTDYPAPVETTSSGENATFAAYRYVLWEFVGSQLDNDIRIENGLYGRRVCESTNFLRGGTTYHKEGDRPFWTHILYPYHRALTA